MKRWVVGLLGTLPTRNPHQWSEVVAGEVVREQATGAHSSSQTSQNRIAPLGVHTKFRTISFAAPIMPS